MKKSFDIHEFMEINWKIPLFFRFLQISPTYKMGYDHVYNGGEIPNCYDHMRLTASAERFGDVWGVEFEEWWFKHGEHWLDVIPQIPPQIAARYYGLSLPSAAEVDLHHQRKIREFQIQIREHLEDRYLGESCPDTMILAIPVVGDPDILEKQTVELLRKELKNLPDKIRRKPRLKFQKNKIRRRTLEKQLFAVYRRAEYYDDLKLPQLAKILEVQYPPKKLYEKDTDLRNLDIQTSELLRKGLFVSEWAAVSEFPKIKKHDRIKLNKFEYVEDDEGRKIVVEPVKVMYDLSFKWKFIQSQINSGNIVPF